MSLFSVASSGLWLLAALLERGFLGGRQRDPDQIRGDHRQCEGRPTKAGQCAKWCHCFDHGHLHVPGRWCICTLAFVDGTRTCGCTVVVLAETSCSPFVSTLGPHCLRSRHALLWPKQQSPVSQNRVWVCGCTVKRECSLFFLCAFVVPDWILGATSPSPPTLT